jgi:hydrogenase maturation factor
MLLSFPLLIFPWIVFSDRLIIHGFPPMGIRLLSAAGVPVQAGANCSDHLGLLDFLRRCFGQYGQIDDAKDRQVSRQATTGKLSAKTLTRLLSRYAPKQDPTVVVGPGIGLDAAAVDVPKGTLVFASDPVTYASEELGRFAVHINANDVFACGAEPCWFLADILLPPGQDRAAEKVFKQIHQACEELNVSLIGGHTEFTPGLPRPLVAGFMIGRVVGKRVLTAGGVQPGDRIILTKGVAIEGTAIVAREGDQAKLKGLSASVVSRAKRLLEDPGISVGPEARAAIRCGANAMHDPTEGGLLNGLWEMAEASRLAIDVDVDGIRVYPETEIICERFGLDALGLLASGALLISCRDGDAEKLLDSLSAGGMPASVMGRARRGTPAVHLNDGRVVKRSVLDEILKVFDADS